jgi:DNA-binding transcriptional LysR family regulator
MKKFDISKLDFHALQVLISVHQLGSISAAAQKFDMSQSSVSYIIERLRAAFDDPLFVRLGRAIEPTARCNEIVKGARTLVQQFEQLAVSEEFDPASAHDRFVISCNFYERSILVPPLIRRIRAAAPGVRLLLIQANVEGSKQLEDAECDLLISPLVGETSGLHVQKLFDEHYACFVDPGSRFAHDGITLEGYAQARHAVVTYTSGWRPFYFDMLDRLGITIEPTVELPSFGSIDRMVAGSDLVLTASAGLERELSPRLVRVRAPFDCRFTEYMSWTGRTHHSAAHRWLRALVEEVAEEVRGG